MHADGLGYTPEKQECAQCGEKYWDDEVVFFLGPDREMWCQYCYEQYEQDMITIMEQSV
jgi:formylmethanofuran dehydrogenase subunit E